MIDLCCGNKRKNIPPCLNANIQIIEVSRPKFARSYDMINVKVLTVYCKRQYGKPITKIMNECELFGNITLMDSAKKK